MSLFSNGIDIFGRALKDNIYQTQYSSNSDTVLYTKSSTFGSVVFYTDYYRVSQKKTEHT